VTAPEDDIDNPIDRVRDARVIQQLRPLVKRAIAFAREELEPRILRGLAQQRPRFTVPEAVVFAEGLTEAAVNKVTKDFSEFDRGVFRSAVARRLEGLLEELRGGWYPVKGAGPIGGRGRL